jgi:hypothetical protein
LVFAEGPAGVCGAQGPPQKTPRLRQRPRGFDKPLTGSGGRLCRGAISSGAFWDDLSGPAAVARAGEKMAAAPAHRRPQRSSMRIDRIAQFRINKAGLVKSHHDRCPSIPTRIHGGLIDRSGETAPRLASVSICTGNFCQRGRLRKTSNFGVGLHRVVTAAYSQYAS